MNERKAANDSSLNNKDWLSPVYHTLERAMNTKKASRYVCAITKYSILLLYAGLMD